MKIYYTDERTLDTIRSYISQSNFVKRENGEIDTIKKIDAYKIIGVDEHPLYVYGHDCFKLFKSVDRYLWTVGLKNSIGRNAMDFLIFQCRDGSVHRSLEYGRSSQIVDPFRAIVDSPRVKVK